jgi:hypothetical protein
MIGRPETHPVKKVIGFTEEMIAAVESWRAKQKPVPNLSEAIRRLVELGLSKPSSQPRVLSTSKQSAARAVELAAKTVDKHDLEAPPEERAVRKRKLIREPSVFRNTRKDRLGK